MTIGAAAEPATNGQPKGVDEAHILWISEGMSCVGDTVSITAATQPAIEDVDGLVPGLPTVHLLAEAFLAPYRAAARGELSPFVLVIEGSIPNENINGDGTDPFGNDEHRELTPTSGSTTSRRRRGVVAIGTCATYGGIHAMAGNPTGCMGLADYLGWTSAARPGCR